MTRPRFLSLVRIPSQRDAHAVGVGARSTRVRDAFAAANRLEPHAAVFVRGVEVHAAPGAAATVTSAELDVEEALIVRATVSPMADSDRRPSPPLFVPLIR
jgi:hypothetical protein